MIIMKNRRVYRRGSLIIICCLISIASELKEEKKKDFELFVVSVVFDFGSGKGKKCNFYR